MNERPLALSTEQVRALIGREMPAGPFKPGIYWVREMIRHAASGRPSWIYAADAEPVEVPEQMVGEIIRWARAQKRARIPASHMPRFASRFTLVVGEDLSVRVEEINIDRIGA